MATTSGKNEKRLVAQFWSTKAPEEWKRQKKNKGRKTKVNKRLSQCKDPFHFYDKIDDLSKERTTKCPCSEYHRPLKRLRSTDIRSFTGYQYLPRDPIELETYIFTASSPKKDYHRGFNTKQDKVREQHDRSKKRKQATITQFFNP